MKHLSSSEGLSGIIRGLLYIMPLALVFSYFPVIRLGGDETMNLELSLPLIWLVVFDAVAFTLLISRRELFKGFRNKWAWLLFPLWIVISVFWSLNVRRGILTGGVFVLLCFAGYAIWSLKDYLNVSFCKNWKKWFFGSAIMVCVWCVIQCVLDLVGVGREYSLMCQGCTYQMFGFPHPNGFAIEPQFMGNLLLAPSLLAAYLICKNDEKSRCGFVGLLVLFAVILFLTFSRGAIYAFVVALIFMSAFLIAGKREGNVGRIATVWGVVIISFVIALNFQGIMAQVGPTNDNYITGVTKVLNHLSLGLIDVRSNNESVEGVQTDEVQEEKAVFDGYVAESTDVRMELNSSAFQVWSKDAKSALFGVGLGGAGQALFNAGLTSSPKEVVQNEYVSLLLETGVIGVSLLIIAVYLAIRLAIRNPLAPFLLTLGVAFLVTLLFFSGLPNALHIYLLPVVFVFMKNPKKLQKNTENL